MFCFLKIKYVKFIVYSKVININIHTQIACVVICKIDRRDEVWRVR